MVHSQVQEEDDPETLFHFTPGTKSPAEMIPFTEKGRAKALRSHDTIGYLEQSYILLVSQASSGQVDEAMETANQAGIVATRFGHTEWMIRMNLLKGILLYNRSQYDLALKHFLEVRGMSARAGLQGIESEALNYIGKYYHSKGNFKESIKYYEYTLILAEKTGDTLRMASVLNNIGKHYMTLNDFSLSLEYCLRSLRLQEKQITDYEVYGSTCNHLGTLYSELGDFRNALLYHNQALSVRQSIHYLEGIGKSYLNLGKLYFRMNGPDSALFFCRKALDIFNEVDYTKGRIKALLLLSQIHIEQKQLDLAHSNSRLAQELSAGAGYTKGIIRSGMILAEIDLVRGQATESIDRYRQCLMLAVENGWPDAERDCLKGLQNAYERAGEFERANQYGKQYNQMNEQLLKSEYSNRIANLQVRFETEESKRLAALLQADNDLKSIRLKRKNQLVGFAVFCLLLLFALSMLLYRLYRLKNRDNVKLRELNRELKLANREKDRFFSIIAHELRNPLFWVKNITETLSQRVDQMDRQKLNEALLSLNDSAQNTYLLMDNLLNWTRSKLDILPFHPATFRLRDLIAECTAQFAIQAKQKGLVIQSDLPADHEVTGDREQYSILFRNLVSNAMKFTPPGGSIWVLATGVADGLRVRVQDTGIGIEPGMIRNLFDENRVYTTLGLMQEKGTGIGLKLCREIAIKNGARLEVSSEPGKGTAIDVWIPLAVHRLPHGKAKRARSGFFPLLSRMVRQRWVTGKETIHSISASPRKG